MATAREIALELGDGGTEDELRAVEHAPHGGVDLGLDAAVLRLKVSEWNHDTGWKQGQPVSGSRDVAGVSRLTRIWITCSSFNGTSVSGE